MSESYWCSSAPNIPRVWSASSISTLASCPRKFELKYVEGWASREENLDFSFGSAFHDGLQKYWESLREGLSKDDALDQAILAAWATKLPPVSRPKQAGKTPIGLARALVTYSDAYPDNHEDILTVNDRLAFEVPFTIVLPLTNPDGEPYKLSGYLDLIRTFAGAYTVVDNKTTASALTDFYFQKFEIHFQNYIYSAAAQILTGHEITQFLIDATAILPSGGVDLQRRPINLTPGEIDEGMRDVLEWIRLAEYFAGRNYYPKNPDGCTFCEFNKICNKDPKLRAQFLESDFSEQRRTIVKERK